MTPDIPLAPLATGETITPTYIRPRDAARRLGVSTSTLWAWIAAGKLPRPQKIGTRVSVWRLADIDAAFVALLSGGERGAA